jgi:hypothetical protein
MVRFSDGCPSDQIGYVHSFGSIGTPKFNLKTISTGTNELVSQLMEPGIGYRK